MQETIEVGGDNMDGESLEFAMMMLRTAVELYDKRKRALSS